MKQWAAFSKTWHIYDAKWQNPFQSAKVVPFVFINTFAGTFNILIKNAWKKCYFRNFTGSFNPTPRIALFVGSFVGPSVTKFAASWIYASHTHAA